MTTTAVAVREKPLIETYETEAEWLKARTSGIGASEAAAVFGVSPYQSPYQLWAQKVGLDPEGVKQEREHLQWGKWLQGGILTGYAHQTQRTVRGVTNVLYRHPELPWLVASPDGFVQEGGQDVAVVEAKNVTEFKREEWEDTPPDLFLIQVQHQLLVTGLSWGALAGLIGGNRLKHLDVQHNQDLADVILETLSAFWLRVQREDPPSPDGSEETKRLLNRIHNRPEKGKYIALPTKALTWDREIVDLTETIKTADARKGELENLLRAEIGDAHGGILTDGTRWSNTLISTPERTVVYPAVEYRRLTRAQPKKNGR